MQLIVTLQDGLDVDEQSDMVDRLMGVRGVYAVSVYETGDLLPPVEDPNQPYMFAGLDEPAEHKMFYEMPLEQRVKVGEFDKSGA